MNNGSVSEREIPDYILKHLYRLMGVQGCSHREALVGSYVSRYKGRPFFGELHVRAESALQAINFLPLSEQVACLTREDAADLPAAGLRARNGVSPGKSYESTDSDSLDEELVNAGVSGFSDVTGDRPSGILNSIMHSVPCGEGYLPFGHR